MCVGGGAQISAQGHAKLGTMVSTKRTVVLYLGTLCMEAITPLQQLPDQKAKKQSIEAVTPLQWKEAHLQKRHSV